MKIDSFLNEQRLVRHFIKVKQAEIWGLKTCFETWN